MRIQKRFLLSITVSLVISVFIILAVLSILQDMDREVAGTEIYREIEKTTNALSLSISRFPRQPETSRIQQIKASRASLENLLSSLESNDIIKKALIQHIRANTHELEYLLNKLILSSSEPAARERQNVLISHLGMKSQFILDDTQRLMEISQSQIDAAQNQAYILIVSLIIALVLINTAISLFSRNRIIRAQEGLRKALDKAKEGERLTRQSQSRLIEAQRLAKVGDWEWDPLKDEVSWSQAMYDIFGRSPELSPPPYQEHRRYYTNDSWARLEESVKRALVAGKSYEFELEHIREDGTHGWHVTKAEALLDGAGHTTKLRGTAQDITAHKLAEETLRKSEERFRALISASSEVLYQMNPDWSEMRQLHSHGFLANTERSNPNWLHEYIPLDEQAQMIAAINDAVGTKSTFAVEHRVWRADGSMGWTYSRAVPLFDENGKIIEWFGAASDITERKKAEQELRQWSEILEQKVAERTELAEKRSKQLQSLSVELIEAEERERRRISQLLHEDLQQCIAAARYQLQSFRQDLVTDPVLVHVENILVESIAKSRTIAHELSPPMLEHSSLDLALQWLARHMGEQFGLQVELELSSDKFDSEPIKVFMFRALQELLFNVCKHSGVNSAKVRLSRQNDKMVVVVSDQGRGFNMSILDSAVVKDCFGLLSLRERASYIGGNFLIESAPEQGSRFILSVPVGLTQSEIAKDVTDRPGSADVSDGSTITGRIRVLLVDDHKVMRQGLIKLISGKPDIEVAGEAASGPEAIELARQIKPNVIVMDISMPGMDGIEATRRIKAEQPEVRVIGLSMFEDENVMQMMREAKAEAFLSKNSSSAELLRAIYGTSGECKNTQEKA